MSASGLQWDKLMAVSPAERAKHWELVQIRHAVQQELAPIAESYINKMDWDLLQEQFQALDSLLQPYRDSSSAVTQVLMEALARKDHATFRKGHETTRQLWDKNETVQWRKSTLQKLGSLAPEWAQAIRNREGIHGESHLPGNMSDAWKLKQLQNELVRRSRLSADDLQKDLQKTRSEFKDVTLQLVERKAWLALKRKTTLKQQNALMGWKLLMKRVGKGTGIRAPMLLEEARALMPECQTAVPVWIMPLNRVVESFNPSSNRFDVVIVDEASQADVMALTALYMGSQVVVVGDDQQVSPDAVGQKQDEVQKIIDMHLNGIPNAALYDGQTSIYDLAKTSFSGMTQLREHFRCVEPIIQFSNALSYKGTILPLRDSSSVKTRPFTVEYRVEGATSTSKVNQAEAQTIASLILACIEEEEYKDSTFGVISLLGEEQALVVDQYLHRYLPASEYKKRKIRCGNSAQFQGDERDVIFLSMVRASEGDGPLSLMGDPGERMKKRYNVAASRARDQMWLVHSLNTSTDLKEGDLRKRLLDHFKNPMAASELYKQVEPRTESEFEREVIKRLLNVGYIVVPQWKVGAYRIDMVVEGAGKRLAVECDGDRWHPIGKLGEDMARQAILERLGWTFVRIRGSEFYRSPDMAMNKIFAKLEAMGIARELHQAQEHDAAAEGTDLKARVISRAALIRQEWAKSQEEYPHVVQKRVGWRSSKPHVVDVTPAPRPPVQVEQPVPVLVSTSEPREKGETLPVIEEAFDLLDFLQKRKIPYIDKRDKGGALWVVGGRSLNGVMKELQNKHEINFHYVDDGSKTTQNQPAWFTKWNG